MLLSKCLSCREISYLDGDELMNDRTRIWIKCPDFRPDTLSAISFSLLVCDDNWVV